MLTRQDVEDGLSYMNSQGLIRLGRVTGAWRQLYCPFHSDGKEHKPSCGCSLDGGSSGGKTYYPGTFHCFACGVTYSFSEGIKTILSLKETSIEAHSYLEKFIDSSSYNSDNSDKLLPDEMALDIISNYNIADIRARLNISGQAGYVPESELATYRFTIPYMYDRKLTDAVIEKYDVGYDANFIPPGRKKPLPCVTFPVRDLQGNTLFLCRRSVIGKFFNYPEGITKPVYGLYELDKHADTIIICESVFNALTAVVYGYNAVALLGTGNPYQISQLRQLGAANYVLCLDNDAAGHKGAAKLKKALSGSGLVWVMTVPEGKDANDLSKQEFDACYAERE